MIKCVFSKGFLGLLFGAYLLGAGSLQAAVSHMSEPDKARDRALGKRDYMILCFGDWDPYSKSVYDKCWRATMHLNKELESGTVLSDLSFPQYPSESEKKRWQKKNEGFNQLPRCLPSVYMFDDTGYLYCILAGSELSPNPPDFAKAIGDVQKKRVLRDELLKKAKTAKGDDRIKYMREAGDIEGIGRPPKLLALAKEYDGGDSNGLVRRYSFDIFKLHPAFDEDKKKGLDMIDKYAKDDKLTKQDRQMVYGLRASFLRRKNGSEKEIKECYEQMTKINPDSFYGKVGVNAIKNYYGDDASSDTGPSDEYIGQNTDDE